MTRSRAAAEEGWLQTALWLADLHGEPSDVAAAPTDAPMVAETLADPADDAAIEPEPAEATETAKAVVPECDSTLQDASMSVIAEATDSTELTPEEPASHDPADAEYPAPTEDHGNWWLVEPPPDYQDYFPDRDLAPVDLDHPSPAAVKPVKSVNGVTVHGATVKSGQGASTNGASDINDPEDGNLFDPVDGLDWSAHPAPAPSPDPASAPTDVIDTTTAPDDSAKTPPRFNKALAISFAGATILGTVAVTSMLLGMRSEPTPDAGFSGDAETQISVVAAPPAPIADPAGVDTPIPFVASADCPAGSTPAQSVAGDDPTRAWVCVRGGVDGQVLTLDLGRTMLVTALSITPGWVGTDATGTDQWLAHRVVTRVQWVFDGDPSTVMTQNTGTIRGEAVQPVPGRGVLASKITMIVLQTSRPPADVTPTPTPGAGGGLLDDALPMPGGLPAPASQPTETFSLPGLPAMNSQADPVDNTFAVSAIKVLGHPPQ